MSLNQYDNLFLSLVRCAVSSKCDDSSAFSGKDWTEIIKMSFSQVIPVLLMVCRIVSNLIPIIILLQMRVLLTNLSVSSGLAM